MYVELSHVLNHNIPNYPDSPLDELEPLLRHTKGDNCNTSMIHHYTHNGTHIDAPFHFDPEGRRVESIQIEDLIYEHPVFIDLPKGNNEEISRDDLKAPDLREADVLLIRTGFDEKRTTDPAGYRFLFPGIDVNAAEYMREELPLLKALVIDFLSVDNYLNGNRNNFPVHHILLCARSSRKGPLLLIEDANLKPLVKGKLIRIFALPFRFEGADGAPVNLLAEVQ